MPGPHRGRFLGIGYDARTLAADFGSAPVLQGPEDFDSECRGHPSFSNSVSWLESSTVRGSREWPEGPSSRTDAGADLSASRSAKYAGESSSFTGLPSIAPRAVLVR